MKLISILPLSVIGVIVLSVSSVLGAYEAKVVPSGEILSEEVDRDPLATASLIGNLVALARDLPDLSDLVRAKALGIARAVQPRSKDAVVLSAKLERGTPVEAVDGVVLATVVSRLLEKAAAYEAEEGASAKRLAYYLFDLAVEVDPASEDGLYGVEMSKLEDSVALWGGGVEEGVVRIIPLPESGTTEPVVPVPAEESNVVNIPPNGWFYRSVTKESPFSRSYRREDFDRKDYDVAHSSAISAFSYMGSALIELGTQPVSEVAVTAQMRLRCFHLASFSVSESYSRKAYEFATGSERAESNSRRLSAITLLQSSLKNARGRLPGIEAGSRKIAKDVELMSSFVASIFLELAGSDWELLISDEKDRDYIRERGAEVDWSMVKFDADDLASSERTLAYLASREADTSDGAMGSSQGSLAENQLSNKLLVHSEGAMMATIKGLLVSQIDEAGRLKGIANDLYVHRATSPKVHFRSDVGSDMSGSLRVIYDFLLGERKLTSLRDEPGYIISFEERYSSKDGPSATVGCTLMVDSAVTGEKLASHFAITGDMNHTGLVLPIGGAPAKLRAAAGADCKLVLVPWDNRMDVSDYAVENGVAALMKMQVFGVKNYDEARALAMEERTSEIQEALDAYEALMAKGAAGIRSAEGRAELGRIIKVIPHHLGARMVATAAAGKLPSTLSPRGSMVAIERAASDLIASLEDADGDPSSFTDDFSSSVSALNALKPKVNAKVSRYLNSLYDFGQVIRKARNARNLTQFQFDEFRAELDKTVDAVQKHRAELLRDFDLQEEMGF